MTLMTQIHLSLKCQYQWSTYRKWGVGNSVIYVNGNGNGNVHYRKNFHSVNGNDKKLSYRRETARQLHTSFSARSLIVHFTEHRTCFTTI